MIHAVCRFVLNEFGPGVLIECTCGWEVRRDNATELFDEWYEHKRIAELEEWVYGTR